MSGHAPTADEDLRVIALAAALECEGPKALTGEVLAAAEEILSLPERAARRRRGQRHGALMVRMLRPTARLDGRNRPFADLVRRPPTGGERC
jgi:hypothetical protein